MTETWLLTICWSNLAYYLTSSSTTKNNLALWRKFINKLSSEATFFHSFRSAKWTMLSIEYRILVHWNSCLTLRKTLNHILKKEVSMKLSAKKWVFLRQMLNLWIITLTLNASRLTKMASDTSFRISAISEWRTWKE